MSRRQPATPNADAAERIREAATALFSERGYFGTPVRALASSVAIEAGSLYYHFPSKQQILFDNFARTMDDINAGLDAALAGVSLPEARFRAAVRFHVLFHTERQNDAFISHSEMRALTPANRAKIIAKRRRYEQTFCALLDDGVKAGVFTIADTKLTTIAILTLCSGVADWFKGEGRLDAEAVADRYVEIAERIAGFTAPARKPERRRGR